MTHKRLCDSTNKQKKREGGRKGSPAPLPPFISLRFFFSSNLSVSEASGNQGGKMGGGVGWGRFPPPENLPLFCRRSARERYWLVHNQNCRRLHSQLHSTTRHLVMKVKMSHYF